MLFFRKSARPRRAPNSLKSRLCVEQLETRLTPTLVLDSGLSTIASSGSGGLSSPAVATDADGDYVVSWSSSIVNGSGLGVYAQRYSANGTPQGATTRVSTNSNNQQDPSVAMDAIGDSVVTWSSYGQDGSYWAVYAQRYSANGTPQGGEFRVNTNTVGDKLHARVAMDSVGDFVVTWQSYGQDGSGWGVYGQSYSSSGTPQGGEFQVNTCTSGDQAYPAIAMNGTGNFVITWSSYGQDGSGWGVYAQRYSSTGTPKGGEFQVNTTTTGDQNYSAVGMDAAGDFVLSWSSNGQGSYGQSSSWGVYAQRYNALGVAQGGEFLVSNTTVGNQQSSAVSMDAVGDFVITWSSYQGSTYGTYAQEFSAAGTALGSSVQIGNTSTNSTLSALSMTGTGQVVLISTGTSNNGTSGIYSELGFLA
jgi:hypothetical protein